MSQKAKQSQKSSDNGSFMDKFKNKHSVISKEGLLKLFENKRKSICNFSHLSSRK